MERKNNWLKASQSTSNPIGRYGKSSRSTAAQLICVALHRQTKQLCTKTKFHEYRIKDICSFALADFCIHLKPLQSRKLPRSQSTTKIPNIFLNSIKLKNLICKNKSISRQISNEHFEPSHPPILASILLISTVINFWSSFWQTNSFPRWSWVSANLDWAPKIHCLNP